MSKMAFYKEGSYKFSGKAFAGTESKYYMKVIAHHSCVQCKGAQSFTIFKN